MMMMQMAPQWVTGLANSLENKYKAKFQYTNFLDVWVDWWANDSKDAIEFFDQLGATEAELKAWLYMKGDDQYEDDLIDEFKAALI